MSFVAQVNSSRQPFFAVLHFGLAPPRMHNERHNPRVGGDALRNPQHAIDDAVVDWRATVILQEPVFIRGSALQQQWSQLGNVHPPVRDLSIPESPGTMTERMLIGTTIRPTGVTNG